MTEDDFKDTEIGRIPKEWKVVTFEFCINKIHNRLKSVEKSNYKSLGRFPIVDQGQNLITGYSDEKDLLFKEPLPVIIFGDHTRIFKFIDFQFITGADGTKILAPNVKKFNPLFLYYQFLSLKIPSKGYNRHFKLLREFPIMMPDIAEQNRIAYVLSTIQNTIEIQDKMIGELQKLKKSMMHKLFTEGIGHTEFKDTEIGRVPKEWAVKKLSELFTVQHGISITPVRRSLEPNFPMLRTLNVYWGKINLDNLDYTFFSDKEITNLNLQFGDLLVCEGGDIGRTAMWEEDMPKIGYQNHLHRLRKKILDISSSFYTYWMQYAILFKKLYINQGNKTTIPNLSQSRLMGFYVIYPPSTEQTRIAEILQTIDNKITMEEEGKEHLKNLFNTMLNKLMTGRIRVKDLVMPA